MSDPDQCCVPGCTNKFSENWTTVVIPHDQNEPTTQERTCFHHLERGVRPSGPRRAPVEIALDEAAKVGKKVVCVPSHRGWNYEAWRDEEVEGRICWRENLGDNPKGERGPIRHWPEDPFPSRADLYGWIVTAT